MTIFQTNLFAEDAESSTQAIDGLIYLPNYITVEQEAELIATIDEQPWLNDLKRRVQHYGWKYDYKARRIDPSMNLGNLPNWLHELSNRLVSDGLFQKAPDQVIINEYQTGQGIAPHVDCVPCFEDTIASLSLGSSCVMDFTHGAKEEKIPTLLEPYSLLVLGGNARHHWKHGIASRKTDKYQGQTLQRGRRISLTFRNIIID